MPFERRDEVVQWRALDGCTQQHVENEEEAEDQEQQQQGIGEREGHAACLVDFSTNSSPKSAAAVIMVTGGYSDGELQPACFLLPLLHPPPPVATCASASSVAATKRTWIAPRSLTLADECRASTVDTVLAREGHSLDVIPATLQTTNKKAATRRHIVQFGGANDSWEKTNDVFLWTATLAPASSSEETAVAVDLRVQAVPSSGDVPSPRCWHRTALHSNNTQNTLFVFGGDCDVPPSAAASASSHCSNELFALTIPPSHLPGSAATRVVSDTHNTKVKEEENCWVSAVWARVEFTNGSVVPSPRYMCSFNVIHSSSSSFCQPGMSQEDRTEEGAATTRVRAVIFGGVRYTDENTDLESLNDMFLADLTTVPMSPTNAHAPRFTANWTHVLPRQEGVATTGRDLFRVNSHAAFLRERSDQTTKATSAYDLLIHGGKDRAEGVDGIVHVVIAKEDGASSSSSGWLYQVANVLLPEQPQSVVSTKASSKHDNHNDEGEDEQPPISYGFPHYRYQGAELIVPQQHHETEEKQQQHHTSSPRLLLDWYVVGGNCRHTDIVSTYAAEVAIY